MRPAREKGPSWGGSAEVPSYLNTLLPGVYKVTGEASGSPGWSCEESGYIDIKGGPASAAAAAGGVLALGGGGMALGGKGPSLTESSQISPNKVSSKWKGLVAAIKKMLPDVRASLGADAAMALALVILTLLFWGLL